MLRAHRARQRRERDLAVFAAWQTANLVRAKRIPMLSRLLRLRRRPTEAEKAAVLADVAAAEAEFARIEARNQATSGS